jgi:hypothetical protein
MNYLLRYLSTLLQHARVVQAMSLVVMSLASLLILAGSCLAGFSLPDTRGPTFPFFCAFLSPGFRGPTVTDNQPSESDRLLFEQNCTLCHTTELVIRATEGWDRNRIRSALDHLNRLNPAMPDYKGTPREKDRLADYIFMLNKERKPRQ